MTPIILLLLTAVLFVLYKYRYVFSLLRYRLAISPTQKNIDQQAKGRTGLQKMWRLNGEWIRSDQFYERRRPILHAQQTWCRVRELFA